MNRKTYFSFSLGMIIGGALSSLLTYIYMKKKEEEVYNWDENNENDIDEEVIINPTYDEKEDDIKEKLLKNWDKPPIGRGANIEEEMAEAEHPVDSDEDEDDIYDEETKAIEEGILMQNFYDKNKNRPPRVISSEEVGEVPENFEREEWLYFDKDRVITNEEEEVIEDYGRFIGTCLEDSGFTEDNEYEHIYIISYEYATIYSINKYFLSYKEKTEGREEYFNDLKNYS